MRRPALLLLLLAPVMALALAPTLAPAWAGADATQSAQADLATHRQAEAAARIKERADAARAALLAEQQVAAAAALRRLEDQTGADTQTLASLQAQTASASLQLQSAQKNLESLLPVMQRLAAQPAATLFAAPQSPTDAVRGIAIMQGIAAAIAAQATSVQTQSARLSTLLAQGQAEQTQLTAAAAAQQAAEAALQSRIDAARATELADADAAAREAAASAEAARKLASITAAVTRLVPPGAAANLPAGSGGAPVAGRILQAFGAATPAGPADGVSYSAAPGGRVTSPCSGTVVFAAPFPAYGLMVITDCGGGASVVLAGMSRLDVSPGQHLAHGQPVGVMAGYTQANPTRQPVLFVQLRRNGAVADPTAWLSGRR